MNETLMLYLTLVLPELPFWIGAMAASCFGMALVLVVTAALKQGADAFVVYCSLGCRYVVIGLILLLLSSLIPDMTILAADCAPCVAVMEVRQ